MQDEQLVESTSTEEEVQQEQPNEKENEFLARYVEPHYKKSREVVSEDLERVIADGQVLYNLCFIGRGIYPNAFAVHHSQIDDQDPLNFFVTADGEIIINPVIINHTKVFVKSREGCMSFPGLYPIETDRYNKCTVRYQALTGPADKPLLTDFVEENLSGRKARIFQHEIQHANGENIYEKEK